MKKLFDEYEFKARFSVVIILVSPIMLTLYLQIKAIQNIASTTIVALTLFALSYLLMLLVRYKGKEDYKNKKRILTIEYLFMKDMTIESSVKRRIYYYLSGVDEIFKILLDDKENNLKEITSKGKEVCASAANWIKENSRDVHIVSKENATYGFFRNLYGIKSYGIGICVIMIGFHIIQFFIQFKRDISLVTSEYMISFVIVIIYLFLWIFSVRKSLIDFCAKNYAEALIRSFDKKIQIKDNENNKQREINRQ